MFAETLQSDNNVAGVDDSSEQNRSNPNTSTSSLVTVRNEVEQANTGNAMQPEDSTWLTQPAQNVLRLQQVLENA